MANKPKIEPIVVSRPFLHVRVSMERFSQQYQRAQFLLDGQIMNDMKPFMPMQTGGFIQRVSAASAAMQGNGKVVAAVPPYGRFLYYGKTMVDELTGSPWARKGAKKVLVGDFEGETRAKPDLTFSTNANPKAQPFWFEAAKKEYGKSWVKLVKKTAGGG